MQPVPSQQGLRRDHKGANSQCTDCSTGSFSDYTCYNCRVPARMQQKHKKINSFSDCADCQPNGKSY